MKLFTLLLALLNNPWLRWLGVTSVATALWVALVIWLDIPNVINVLVSVVIGYSCTLWVLLARPRERS